MLPERVPFMNRIARGGAAATAIGLVLGLAACTSDDAEPDSHGDHGEHAAGYVQTNLVANWDAYKPQIVEPDLKNAWGISMRPAGAGGHFWITANGTGKSFEYVGDVAGKKLFQDDLKEVTVPGAGKDAGTPTGTVFNAAGKGFVISQQVPGAGKVTQPATFLFATDTGRVTAWTEVKHDDGTASRPTDSVVTFDRSAQGASYLGMAISPTDSPTQRIYLADFGAKPGLVVLDDTFKPVKDAGFESPFADGYKPFNVQTIGDSVFVVYAEWDEPGEEEPGPGEGKVAEFSPEGKLIQKWDGGNYLNAPWGIAKAPEKGFGKYNGDLLVSNFGDGTIAVLDSKTHKAVDFLRRPDGLRVEIDGIWGLAFGNGESLGMSDALYFAAGPGPEADGIFGRLTWQG
jgi:uncharacterized protein (TIGR03118 family)